MKSSICGTPKLVLTYTFSSQVTVNEIVSLVTKVGPPTKTTLLIVGRIGLLTVTLDVEGALKVNVKLLPGRSLIVPLFNTTGDEIEKLDAVQVSLRPISYSNTKVFVPLPPMYVACGWLEPMFTTMYGVPPAVFTYTGLLVVSVIVTKLFVTKVLVDSSPVTVTPVIVGATPSTVNPAAEGVPLNVGLVTDVEGCVNVTVGAET